MSDSTNKYQARFLKHMRLAHKDIENEELLAIIAHKRVKETHNTMSLKIWKIPLGIAMKK